MDIHAPQHPILTWREFFVHILVVSCGILIALGLEGMLETIHNHRLVRETRENVRQEMSRNLEFCKDELTRVTLYNAQLKSLAADVPALAKEHPEEINSRLAKISNPGYFFVSNSWQTALSTGALGHMTADEVSAYGDTAQVIKTYSELQMEAYTQEAATKSFFQSHPHLTPDQTEQGTEHLLLFSHAEQPLANVAPQLKESIERSLRAASDN